MPYFPCPTPPKMKIGDKHTSTLKQHGIKKTHNCKMMPLENLNISKNPVFGYILGGWWFQKGLTKKFLQIKNIGKMEEFNQTESFSGNQSDPHQKNTKISETKKIKIQEQTQTKKTPPCFFSSIFPLSSRKIRGDADWLWGRTNPRLAIVFVNA